MKELENLKKKIKELRKQCLGKPDSRELQDAEERYYNIMNVKKVDIDLIDINKCKRKKKRDV